MDKMVRQDGHPENIDYDEWELIKSACRDKLETNPNIYAQFPVRIGK